MKRIWLGIALLVVIALLGFWLQFGMDKLHSRAVENLDAAANAALQEDWDTALALFRQAQQDWQKAQSITAAAADHSPMDDVERLYAELEIYARQQETDHFAATCNQLSRMTQAVIDAHRLSWRNLL